MFTLFREYNLLNELTVTDVCMWNASLIVSEPFHIRTSDLDYSLLEFPTGSYAGEVSRIVNKEQIACKIVPSRVHIHQEKYYPDFKLDGGDLARREHCLLVYLVK